MRWIKLKARLKDNLKPLKKYAGNQWLRYIGGIILTTFIDMNPLDNISAPEI